METKRVSSGSPFEPVAGYCRALRVGDRIEVAGTAPIADDGTPFAPGDAGAQARRCIEVAARALEELGSGLHQVVRTRIYLTRAQDMEAAIAAHGAVFGRVRPVCTALIVAQLLDPEWLLEIEFEADARAEPMGEPA